MKKLPGIFRDVHPDREPVNLGRLRGQVRVYDIDSRLMARVRLCVAASGRPLLPILRRIAHKGLDALERNGGAL